MIRLLLAWSLVLGAAAADPFANGGFESGSLAGWTASAATVVGGAREGSWMARLQNGSIDQDFDTTMGTAYTATVWLRIDAESGSDWGGFVISATETRNWVYLARSPVLTRATLGDGWRKIAVSFTATTTTSHLLCHYWGGAGRSMDVRVDDVRVFMETANQPPAVTASITPASAAVGVARTCSLGGDDADGAVTVVDWDMGDGTCLQGSAPVHNPALPGSYTAKVRVVDDDGAVASLEVPWSCTGSGQPTIAIASPAAGATSASASVVVSGSAAGSGIAVAISGDRGQFVTASGTTAWSATVPLAPGRNRLLAQVRDGDGRIATTERIVVHTPTAALAVTASAPVSVERWSPLEIACSVAGSAATHPWFPHEADRPAGLWGIDGATLTGEFSDDGWVTVLRRPGFWRQPFARSRKGGNEWMYPDGLPGFAVRFAPPRAGTWQYRVRIAESRGDAVSAMGTFTATAATAGNHGPIAVGSADRRYFAYADGTPFLGCGHGIGFDDKPGSYAAEDLFAAIGTGNQQLLRWWIQGDVWGSAWWAWNTFLPYDATVPATGLSLDSRYGDALASIRLDDANWTVFQGWQSGLVGIVPGRLYRVRIRWRSSGIATATDPAKPFGACVRLVGWPVRDATDGFPLAVAHLRGDTPWHVAEGTITASGSAIAGDYLANPAIIFENCSSGRAYVDGMTIQEVLTGGGLGPNLLRNPEADAVRRFDDRGAATIDAVLAAAQARGMAVKLVVGEKQEWLLSRYGPGGVPAPAGGNVNALGDVNERLHRWHWRHLQARFGAFRSVHSWELANEEEPAPGAHFALTAQLARAAADDGNPHPASTSTWASLAEDAWNAPASAPIPFNDFHCYVRGTGWLGPEDQLAGDSAAFMHAYDDAARTAFSGGQTKPVVWGEQGIDGTSGTDAEDPAIAADATGLWLHKILWARTAPGGTYPIYWYTDNIIGKSLHPRYGAWRRFMAGIPLANGRYVDVQAAVSTSSGRLRAWGQKDPVDGRAHLWVDNPDHTWRAVSVGGAIVPASGTLRFAMGTANTSFTVERWDTGAGAISSTTTTTSDAGGDLAIVVAGLSGDTAFRVRRVGGAATPAVPLELLATADGAAAVVLHWRDAAADESGYEAQCAPAGGAWSSAATTAADADACRIDSLSPGTWRFRVRALGGSPSAWSDVATAVLTAGSGSPPRIVSTPPLSARSGQAWTYAPSATSAAGGVWSLQPPVPAGAAVDTATGGIAWPLPDPPGSHVRFRLRVDTGGGADEQDAVVIVLPPADPG